MKNDLEDEGSPELAEPIYRLIKMLEKTYAT
jgi:hypothetical protein